MLRKDLEINRNVLNKINTNKKRIRSQEIILNKCEFRLGRSLGKIKGLWQENLSEMETSLKFQKETLKRVSKNYFNAMNAIEKEIDDVLEGPSIPNLKLDKIKPKNASSKKLSDGSNKNYKRSEDEIISNRSVFSFIAEDIASFRSYSSRQHASKKITERNSAEKSKNRNRIFKEDHTSNQFENIMNELEQKKLDSISGRSVKNALEKSNSEISAKSTTIKGKNGELSESTQINYNEIKKALIILKKANLINNSGNQELLKIAEMIKDPENSSNVELMIQLINIENKKQQKTLGNSYISKIIGKPSTPSSINRITRFQSMVDNEGTSREKYKFFEEKSLNRTILSNENLLSPKNDDFLDNSLKFTHKNEDLKDVQLEDLLNVSSVFDDLGLISADNSIIQENNKPLSPSNDEVSELKSINKIHGKELPIKNISDSKRISRSIK